MAFDRAIGVFTIACEASNQPHHVRVAVAAAILNRVADGRWGKTVAAVCLKRMQFSEWNADPANNANLERVALMWDDDPVVIDCELAYDQALSGPDPTGGCMWYKNVGTPAAWAAGKTPAVVLGVLEFYNNID